MTFDPALELSYHKATQRKRAALSPDKGEGERLWREARRQRYPVPVRRLSGIPGAGPTPLNDRTSKHRKGHAR